jgi:hypothetical protein
MSAKYYTQFILTDAKYRGGNEFSGVVELSQPMEGCTDNFWRYHFPLTLPASAGIFLRFAPAQQGRSAFADIGLCERMRVLF